MLKQQKGVTLVALVITIIVLLILAGVSIAMLTGDNGVLTKAKTSQSETLKSEAKEKVSLAINTIMANKVDPTSASEEPKTISGANITTVLEKENVTANEITTGAPTGGFIVELTIGTKKVKVTGTPVSGKTDVFTLEAADPTDE